MYICTNIQIWKCINTYKWYKCTYIKSKVKKTHTVRSRLLPIHQWLHGNS